MKSSVYGYGRLSSISIFLYIVLLIAFPLSVSADDSPYIEKLLKKAEHSKLYEEKYWKTLMHYRDTLFGMESLIDDPKFFLAKDGKYNSKAEMFQTIRVFFDSEYKGKQVPVCSFMARYTWLMEKLGPEKDKIPQKECEKLSNFKVGKATIIFPTYYLNNPASMFGHTFLNLDTEYKSDLLSNAVNYAASVGNSDAFSYALSGIFGFFKGYFSILPYYKKISEYSDMDQRDIWEYRLNLTEEELRRMVYHIYELEGVYSDYYFFDENCSYNILYLLESARPSLDLTSRLDAIYVIPIDTVKEMKKQGIVEKSDFRPSNSTKIKHKASLLNSDEIDIAHRICLGKIAPKYVLDLDMDGDKKIIILDLVTEYSKYLFIKRKISRAEYGRITINNLRARSKLGKVRNTDYTIKKPFDPINGHDSKRLLINTGVFDEEWFMDICLRPSFMDMLNSDYSKEAGVQLQFFNTRFRYYFEEEDFDLESFYLFDIFSISPRDRFFKPLSWKVNAGIYKKFMEKGRRLVTFTNVGFGLSYNWFPGLCYIMPEVEADFDDSLYKGHSVGYGGSIGVMSNITENFNTHLSGRFLEFDLGEEHREISATFHANYQINKSNSLGLELKYLKTYEEEYDQYMLKYHLFF